MFRRAILQTIPSRILIPTSNFLSSLRLPNHRFFKELNLKNTIRFSSTVPVDSFPKDREPETKKLGHIPVLKKEVLDILDVEDGKVYLDATFGYGGYTKAILDSNSTCKVVAIDQDPYAYLRAHEMAMQPAYNGRLLPLLGKFGDVALLLDRFKARYEKLGSVYLPEGQWLPELFDGLVMDVGLSSGQLDDPTRGFSFMRDGRLDMRMCQVDLHNPPPVLKSLPEVDWKLQQELYASRSISAYDVVNYYSVVHLGEIIRKFGEERFAKRIAQAICEARDSAPIETTGQLSNIVSKLSPRHQRPTSLYGKLFNAHPATRTFQGLRIYVNKELEELSKLLAASPDLLKPGGMLAAVSFHSLEDRLVKRFLINGHEALSELAVKNQKKDANNSVLKATRRLRHREKMSTLTSEVDSSVDGIDPASLESTRNDYFELDQENDYDQENLEETEHPLEKKYTLEIEQDEGFESALEVDTDENPKAMTVDLGMLAFAQSQTETDEFLPFLLPKRRSDGLITASSEELEANPRSRSAKLRWAIRA